MEAEAKDHRIEEVGECSASELGEGYGRRNHKRDNSNKTKRVQRSVSRGGENVNVLERVNVNYLHLSIISKCQLSAFFQL